MSYPLVIAVLLLQGGALQAQVQLYGKGSLDCFGDECRTLKPSTPAPTRNCWSASEAAVALLNWQCKLASCGEAAAIADTADGSPTTSQAILQRLFAYVDTNSDGLATQPELLAALASLSSSSTNTQASCIDVLLTAGGGDDGSEDVGVGQRRFAALLGIRVAKVADDRSDQVATSLLDEGSEAQLSAPVDRDFRMRCPLSTVGKAERVQWRRHGNRLTLSSRPGRSRRFNWWQSGTSDTLVFKSVTLADAGIYECCSSVWQTLCITLALNVIDQPRVRVYPPMQVRRVGERAQLYCRLEGARADSQKISWLFNSKPIETRPELASVGSPTDSGSSLSIAKLEKPHTGLYTCSVGNQAGMAESAGSVYVRDATETDYSSYPLSPDIWTAVGPTPTKAIVFHSDGYAVMDVTDCAVKSPVSARLCNCHVTVGSNDDEQLAECDWGSESGDGGRNLIAAAGRLLYAAQPAQHRLLVIQPTASPATRAWFSPRPLPLGCRPTLLSYRRASDTLWTACHGGKVLRLSRASAAACVVDNRPAVWRAGLVGSRVLRLPDSSSNLLVTLEGSSPFGDGLVLLVATSVPDFGNDVGVGNERARLLVPDTTDMADVIPQGDTLLLHSSTNSSKTQLIAVDLTTGRRIPFFSRFFSANPTGRLMLSERRDRVWHLTEDTMYLYRVLPSGQLALSMHSSLDARPLNPQFQTGPDGAERLLAIGDLSDGGLITVSPGEATMRLTFDPHLAGLSHLSAPEFGSLAIAYSTDSAIFVNTSSGVRSISAACPQSLFVGLQAVHWIWPD